LPAYSQIKIKTDLTPCQIYADEGLWREVVGQLLDNARFGLSHGGELQVTLMPKELSSKEAIGLGVQAAPGIEMSFQDDGPGMSEETLLHAVDPFFSTRPKNLAIGIGLSIAYAVARLHGGQLVVSSREGEGVRVKIWIPCYPAGHSRPTTSTSSGLLMTQGNKVLLLEPDAIAMETATAVLQKAKLYVQAFPDTTNALATFEKKPKNFVLAIINAHVAEPDGIEVARRLRARVPELPIILITGSPQASQAAAQSGLVPPPVVLQRPFKTQALLTEARKLVPAPESGSAPAA
jgi:CheY-like chemotaxis protein